MPQFPQIAGAKAPGSIFETLVLTSQLQRKQNHKLQLIIDQLQPLGAVENALGPSVEYLREAARALVSIDWALRSLAEQLGQAAGALSLIASGELTVKVRIDDCSEEVRELLRSVTYGARAGQESAGATTPATDQSRPKTK
jgi:hypothetical protein